MNRVLGDVVVDQVATGQWRLRVVENLHSILGQWKTSWGLINTVISKYTLEQ